MQIKQITCLLVCTVFFSFRQDDTGLAGATPLDTNSLAPIDAGASYFPLLYVICGFILGIIFTNFYMNKKRKSIKINLTDEQVKGNTDNSEPFGNFFTNLKTQPEAKKLYEKLRRKIHPDRFPLDEDKRTEADKLASELGNSKTDLQRLKEIESIAKEKGLIDENDES